ncbi:MAG: glycosyltransferase [Terracidiphilus sp.]
MAVDRRTSIQRLRVLLLIPHLGGGGAERVIALLARGLSPEKYDLHLAVVTQPEAVGASLPPWVTVHALGARRVRGSALGLLRLVRRVKPGVIVSGIAHLNFLVLLLRPFFPEGTAVLVRQNATVSSALAFGGLPGYTRLLYRLLYRRADRVICQSRSMAVDLTRELDLTEELVAVLPNPLDLDGIRAGSANPVKWPGAGPHLLAIGRLSPEKGFDLLLRAFAVVRASFPAATLTILGVGSEEFALRVLCLELGLERAVSFPGYSDRPSAYFPGATLFVHSSRHEGMPNAVIEAAAAGLPVVALPSSGGVVDFLGPQPGTWVGDRISSECLAECLLEALVALVPGERFAWAFSPLAVANGPTSTALCSSNR